MTPLSEVLHELAHEGAAAAVLVVLAAWGAAWAWEAWIGREKV